MRDLYFFAYHGSVLIILGILPYILASFNQKPLAILLVIGSIISLELLVIGLTNISSPTTAKFIRSIWGAFLGLIAIISFIQIYYFFKTKGGTLNWELLHYAITNRKYVLPIIMNEITLLWWLRLVVIIPIIAMFGYTGWQANRLTSAYRHSFALVCLFSAITLLSTQAGLATAYYLAASNEENIPPNAINDYVKKNSINNLLNAQAKDTTDYNIVIVILESIRANATTPYGSEFDTTPFLNKLAETGLKADQAYVVTPHTSKAILSILCGYPSDIHSRRITGSRPQGLPFSCLPKLLNSLGYKSAFFQTATESFENRPQLIDNIGFDHFVPKEKIDPKNWETVNYFGLEDMAMLEPAMDWVDEQEGPFLLSLLTLTSHHYYQVPSTFEKEQYSDKKAWNDYLNTIKYTDDFLLNLWTEFEKRDLIDNTLFIFISDHGERFSGNKTLGHHQSLAQDAIHIPFIVWNPSLIPTKKTVSGPRQQIDVVPTILDLLNIETNNSLPGMSLLDSAKDRTIYTTCLFGQCSGRISGHEKFIHYGESNFEMYNVINDPTETIDLSTATNFSEEKTNQYIKEINFWKQSIKQLYY